MKTPKFTPHMNRELGKYYYTERDYKSDMKKHGIEPYNPSNVTKRVDKPYVRSEWAQDMYTDIKNRKGRPPGDRFLKELDKRGYNQKSYDKARSIANEGQRNESQR